jgi:Flp pilus assembly protein TadG
MLHRTCSSRRAAGAVEFALILPLLFTLVVGCVDFGRFAYYYIAVINAARAGAAYGIMNNFSSSTYSGWASGITQTAKDEIAQQVDASKLQVTVSWSEDANGLRRVHVLTSYPFQTIVTWKFTGLGFVGLVIPNNITLQGQAEMRLIR